MNKSIWKSVFVAAAIGFAGCSSEPATTTATTTDADAAAKKAPAGPPVPIAAKAAFWEMYTPAHAWAGDLLPISVKAGEVAGVKNGDGKAGVWTAVFVSPSQRAQRKYVYSVADQLPDITKGVKAERAEPWAGPTNAVMTFRTADFTVDSDAAYKTAAEKAADWLKVKDNAEKPVTVSLGADSRFPAPVWVILFGTTKSGFMGIVNASTGTIVTR
jgi:hypothetical protein